MTTQPVPSRVVAAIVVASAIMVCSTFAADVPHVTLHNSAEKGMTMPAIGLGTGGYSSDPSAGYGGYPECWTSTTGCGSYVMEAVTTWFDVGGRRLDCANSYHNSDVVGQAMHESMSKHNLSRSDVFVLQKVGPSYPLGYNDSLQQFQQILDDMKLSQVDLLLIHWPYQNPSQGNVSHNATESSDPYCNHTSPHFDATQCRLNTWKALVKIFNDGGARAIGVSNFNVSELEEIRQSGLPMPALTQNPFHIYRSATQQDLIDYCHKHNITFLGYSPFGVPDWKVFPGPEMAPHPLEDPVVVDIARKHNTSPAQVILAWHWKQGIPFNPRSTRLDHMKENLAFTEVNLSDDDIQRLSSRPQDTCDKDPSFYECAPVTSL